MVNWTDKIIHWNQLPGSDVRRLLDTWGMTPEQIARYDRKHGIVSAQPKTPEVVTPEVKPAAKKPAAKKAPAKKAPAKKAPAKKAPAKKVASVTRQRHHGKDGEVRFLEHRNLWIGFAGGKVVVTKRTAEACREVLAAQFGITLQD